MIEVSIRLATPDDLDDILRLNKSLFTYETQFNNEYNQEWTYSEIGKRYFKSRIESANGVVLIAEKDKKMIGYVVVFINNYPFRNNNPIAEIENMFIEEIYRGYGVGTSLMSRVKSIAKERGVKRLKVGALAQNANAIAFYHEAGFKEFEIILEAIVD